MHILRDENNNIIEHGHGDHDHAHTHTHTHADGTTHSHEHTHEGEHEHEHHGHEGTPMDELKAMLKYMVGHNASHVRETQELAEQLKDENPDVYMTINDAVAEFEKGNALLSDALEKLSAE